MELKRADNDKESIAALIRLGLTSTDEIEPRASSTLTDTPAGRRDHA